MLWNSLEPVVVSSNPPMCISCARTFTHIRVHQSLLGRSQLHKSSNFCQKTFFKVHGRSSKGISANWRIILKILCWWMGGLEIKEVWRPSTSCNLFITSFTFSPCLPLVREGIWLNTGSNKNHRRKQDNRSHKNKAIKACFFARVCLLISSRAIYERCLWLLHTSSWATADGGNRKQTWARQETFVSGQTSGGRS